jgi:hypothetical protein
LLEQAHVRRVAVRVVLGVRQQHRVAALPERRLGALDDLGEQRVGDVADDEADRARLPAAQRLGEQVGLVAELGHDRHHLLPHGARHVGVA